ncbi:hypothetical protein ACFVAJ_11060 [Agromyces sp. NPDC057679]|uniref:hypothetical protein n=1 Tax=Agromyces sp. NPDC057679 TaxID=3346207 RepID=UPI00366DD1A3
MAEVDAIRLREAFGADAGCLPDGRVVDSGARDWLEILRVIDEAGWPATWNSDHTVAELGHFGLPAREHDSFAVRPGTGLQINFFFSTTTEVLFDINLRELNDQASVDLMCDVVRRIGQALDKDVVVSQEGSWEQIVLRYEHALDRFTLGAST